MVQIESLTRVRPRIAILLATVLLVLAATGYAMATDHGDIGGHASALAYNPVYSVSGFLVGLLVGLTGVGGGSLMTPLLVLLFGFHPGTAVGTDLLYASATKSVGTIVHGANKTVDWRITGRLALGSVPAALATIAALYVLGIRGDAASRLISTVLGFALILTAISLIFRRQILAFATARLPEPSARMTAILTTVLGAILGVLITLSSVGAGAIGVTILIFLYPRMPMARLVGSDIAHAVPLTLIAGLGHLLLGSVNISLLGALLIGSAPGIILGSYLSARIPDGVLRPILATTLAVVGARMTQ